MARRGAGVRIAHACVEDLMSGRYRAERAATQDAVTDAIAALHRLLGCVKRHWHSGQWPRIVTFLGSLFNGTDFPFDLSELRGVDRDIAADALAVLRLDSLGQKEVQRYVENGDALWQELIEDYGLKPVAQK